LDFNFFILTQGGQGLFLIGPGLKSHSAAGLGKFASPGHMIYFIRVEDDGRPLS
jgi:hypothetical protein